MRRRTAALVAGVIFCAVLFGHAAGNSWPEDVSEADRNRTNPFAGQKDAVAAGARLFANHCAPCHGSDALGRGKRPSLRSPEVQQATDGQIFWMLRNGNLWRGMPTWSSMPEPMRWQIIAYIKSLGEENTANPPKGNER